MARYRTSSKPVGRAMDDEAELIAAAAAGDRVAFDRLVRLKRERVVRVACRITGNWDDALDVAQNVFLKLWHGLGRFRPGHSFDTWLHRITVNAAIDQLRSSGPKGSLQALPDPGTAPSPAAAVDLALLERAFRRLAAGLAPKQRAAFVLHEIEGLEVAEVAEIMGVAESTVRNHLLQARRVLKRGLERDYPELVPQAARTRRSDGESS